ncbi:hypothetical protein V6N13_126500 [Hibiscus sabdariffa]|uniref:Uncharacterized protein n=1 Tax=Hibiscus sabdariffa TaxID=183260 RepID=A0ABR2RFB5_9ROSI
MLETKVFYVCFARADCPVVGENNTKDLRQGDGVRRRCTDGVVLELRIASEGRSERERSDSTVVAGSK